MKGFTFETLLISSTYLGTLFLNLTKCKECLYFLKIIMLSYICFSIIIVQI